MSRITNMTNVPTSLQPKYKINPFDGTNWRTFSEDFGNLLIDENLDNAFISYSFDEEGLTEEELIKAKRLDSRAKAMLKSQMTPAFRGLCAGENKKFITIYEELQAMFEANNPTT
ncbi:hypothetical protein HK101_003692, partial [Irineochytrium annulatum]